MVFVFKWCFAIPENVREKSNITHCLQYKKIIEIIILTVSYPYVNVQTC